MNLFRLFRQKLVFIVPILAILGPGIIAGNADNDAGGITTYSIAGAHFGYSLLWILFLTTLALVVTQEIGARLALVTGKGLGALIREKYGVRWTAFIMSVLFLANIGTIAAEFAGIAASLEIFNVPRIVSVPLAGVLIYIVIIKANFKNLEKIFLLISFFYIAYIFSALKAGPDFGLAFKSMVLPHVELSASYIFTAIALIGTTITPWGQFFIQDYIVDKKLTKEDLKIERADVLIGSFLTNFFAFFIVVATAATLFAKGIHINDAKDAAMALEPFAGKAAATIFGLGFLNASLFGAVTVPLTTAYTITETFGVESGLNYGFSQAKHFYSLIAFILFIGVMLVAIPFFPLINILVATQAINAILLLPIFVFLFRLSNDKKLLGNYANNKMVNLFLIVTLFGISTAALLYVFSLFVPNL